MPLSTAIHETRLRVRYAETDASGIAHHAAYLPWLETGRVEWLRDRGLSYRDLEREGYSLPVVEMRLRYVAPARFDDALVVRTGLAELRSRELRFVYEIVTDEPRPRQLANGTTRHLCLLRGVASPLPAAYRQVLLAADGPAS
jgi:acyl-CoA thioester hydrolase